MEHIKSSTTSTFRAILYSPPHLLMLLIDRHILMQHTHNCNTLSSKESYDNELHSNIW